MAESSPPVQQFLNCALRSGLLTADQLRATGSKAPVAARTNAAQLAEFFVRRGLLSRYQADKLLSGHTVGLVLGPFQILAPLGRGGMGAVYLARDTEHDRHVALKVLPPKQAKRERRKLARFQREMELSEKLNHPVLTRTFSSGVLSEVYYIAMEYIPGQNLARHIRAHGPFDVPTAARYFAETAEGLAYAHEFGLIHRDLKPGNLMVTPNGHAKILDLGLALLAGEELPADRSIVGGKGYIVGTMDFIAPEQTEDPLAVDPRADIYSLGATMYYALTGRPPFPDGSRRDKIAKHRTEAPPKLIELNPTLPDGFADLVERLLAKLPAQRPQSAREVRALLLPWADPAAPAPLDAPANADDVRHALDVATGDETSFDWAAVHHETAEEVPAVPVVGDEKAPWWKFFGRAKK